MSYIFFPAHILRWLTQRMLHSFRLHVFLPFPQLFDHILLLCNFSFLLKFVNIYFVSIFGRACLCHVMWYAIVPINCLKYSRHLSMILSLSVSNFQVWYFIYISYTLLQIFIWQLLVLFAVMFHVVVKLVVASLCMMVSGLLDLICAAIFNINVVLSMPPLTLTDWLILSFQHACVL